MSTLMFSGLICLLGLVGLAGFGLLPLRAWQVFRGAPKGAKFAPVVLFLMSVAALGSEVLTGARIFRCLTGEYCGPNMASGWTSLAVFGVVCVAFEVAVLLLKRMARANKGASLSKVETHQDN